MVKYFELNIIAFGGVATGSIKAHDAAIVAAVININGWTSITTANETSKGKITDVVARFDVISVKKLIVATITKIINIMGNTWRSSNCWLIQTARRLVINALD